jgi:hypothetical protein
MHSGNFFSKYLKQEASLVISCTCALNNTERSKPYERTEKNFDVLKPLSAGLFALTAIEIAWELSITIYAIFIGFRPTQEK